MPQPRALEFERWLEAEFKDLEQPLALNQQHPAAKAAERTASATTGPGPLCEAHELDDEEAATALAATQPCDSATLQAGGFAYATGPRHRPALNDDILQLVRYDSAADRWICAVGDGERVRLRPFNLVHVPDDDDDL